MESQTVRLERGPLYWLACVVAVLAAVLLAGAIAGGVYAYSVSNRVAPKLKAAVAAFRTELVNQVRRSSDGVVEASTKAKAAVQKMEASYATFEKTGKATLEIVQKTNRALYGDDQGPDDPDMQRFYGSHGIMGQVHSLLGASELAVESLQRDIRLTTGDLRKSLAPLELVLSNTAIAVQDLDKAIKNNDPKVGDVLNRVEQSMASLDKILANEDIAKSMDNVQEITKSVSIVMMPWRERASLLKKAVGVLIGIARSTLRVNF